jgi:DNA-binding protein HU-beta
MKNVSDIASHLSEGYGISKKDAETYTKEVFTAIASELSVGEEVNIAGFGKFTVKETAERQGRNPATGAAVTIAASKKASFKAAKQLKDAL